MRFPYEAKSYPYHTDLSVSYFLGVDRAVSLLLDGSDLREGLRRIQRGIYSEIFYPFPHAAKLCGRLYRRSAGEISSEYANLCTGDYGAYARCHHPFGLRLCQTALRGQGSSLYPVSGVNDDSQRTCGNHQLYHRHQSGTAKHLHGTDSALRNLGVLYLSAAGKLCPGARRALLCRQGGRHVGLEISA